MESAKPAYTVSALVALVLIGICLSMQYSHGAFHSELADHPDEAPHFITGTMLHDYVSYGLGTHPIAFAKDYYCHYPKVAFGHWPPVFYIVQSGWYFIFGVSTISAMLLNGAITSSISIVIFLRLKNIYGSLLSFVCAALFFAVPVVQKMSTMFMSETLVGLFCILAMFAFADFLRTDQLKHSLLFALWSACAILTKGNALALAFLPLFAILLTRQFSILKSWRLWLSGIAVGICVIPWYLYFFDTMTNVGGTVGAHRMYRLTSASTAPEQMHTILGTFTIILVVIGAVSGIFATSRSGPGANRANYVCVATALILASLLWQTTAPVTDVPRYLLPAIAAAMVNLAEAIFRIQELTKAQSRIWAMSLTMLVAAVVFLGLPAGSMSRATGYSEIVNGLDTEDCPKTVILISSTDHGEGAVIVSQRILDGQSKGHVVVRASKLLADQSWMGSKYRLRYEPDQFIEVLNRIPVHFVIIDDSTRHGIAPRQHQVLLKQVIQNAPQDFVLVKTGDVRVGETTLKNAIKIYENIPARGKPPTKIEVDLSYSLGGQISTEFDESTPQK